MVNTSHNIYNVFATYILVYSQMSVENKDRNTVLFSVQMQLHGTAQKASSFEYFTHF